MKLQNRIALLSTLREYLVDNGEELQAIKHSASLYNGWFTIEFIDTAIKNITEQFLSVEKLQPWANHYFLDDGIHPKNVGIVMAGNIPLVGFHDFLCVFISGHKQTIKLSSKDDVLMKHLIEKMVSWDEAVKDLVVLAPFLKGCDAYIATGSNNSARYFDYYFSKYPSIIRKNRTSVAILRGDESMETLEKLSDDIHIFFGLGCRNVTKIFVPEGYDFVPLLQSFHRYKYFADHHKYRNNYDYNLSVQIMNNRFYMTNETTLLVESDAIFSPISQLNYGFYKDAVPVTEALKQNEEVQCIAGIDIPFGAVQSPGLFDYADGVDTIQFLLTL
ncbi:MAG: acyl-CoA reductase [Ferruginibacter sp.]|uniref:acyl-CoA reductase n=1 Tax=Ferruginibacter sp. TaxID=1940288 RepID=UPI00265A51B7|nr:acyl-CoA reductase [Ferruginibacter sp.]MDB5278327.1 acyl-CoA reductase [Ferruginibacter sp.]